MNKPVRVLIVEDVEDDALLLAAELERGGFEVKFERVDTAAALRTALEREKWDAILCDFTMPYFSGSAALHVAREFASDVPFIYVSGTIGEEVAIEAMKSGAQDYVMKTNLARLVPAVERALHEAETRREAQSAERAMRESENKYRHLFEALGDAILLIDETSGRIIDANTRAEVLLCRTRGDILGRNESELFLPQAGQSSFARLCSAIAAGRIATCEMQVCLPGGEAVPIQASGSEIELAGHRLLLTVLRDVTERNRMEEQLRQLSRAVEQSPASVVITDTAATIQYVNAKFTALTGYAFAEAVGQNPRILKSGQTPPELYRELWDTITAGKTWRGEFLNKKKSGQLYWELASISPIFNESGQITNYLAVKEDITGRKRTEEKLREQAALLDKAQDVISVRDLNGVILYWNKSAERVSGWSAREAVGKNIADLLIHDPARYEEATKAVLEKGEWIGEMPAQTKDHHEVLIEARWTLVRDANGNPKAILSINTDITEKKKFEAQFLRAQRMESIGTLAGGIAHDLNNIFTPLLMSVRMLRDEIKTPEMGQVLDILEANVRRGTNLVKQVLAFGRGVKGERIPVKVPLIIHEIDQIIHETFPKSIDFESSYDPGLWMVMGDATQLHQVLLNLCVNARDAMPDGGKLTINAQNVTLDDSFVRVNPGSKAGPFVIITVQDTGIGIPTNIQERIFDPFFTTKEPGKGTGLGLFTTLGIVRSHGGFIYCYSEVGRGSMFRVYLPARNEAAARRPRRTTDTEAFVGHNELLLLVDDEESVRTVVKKTLEFYGYRVLTAANGAEAIALYKAHPKKIAAIISDIAMPVMAGLAMITALRAIDPEAKIIMSSGFGSDENVARATAAGISCFVPKPYSSQEMLQALHSLLHPADSQKR